MNLVYSFDSILEETNQLKQNIMKELIALKEYLESLGYSLEGISFGQGVSIKIDIEKAVKEILKENGID